MGQAKQRGSKEQRVVAAIERNALEHQERLKQRELDRIASLEREKKLTPQERTSRDRARKGIVALAAIMGMSGAMAYMNQPTRKSPPPPPDFKIGGRYNWKGQSERLIYLGHNYSGNGYWHQFAKVESPNVIWCEVVTADLHMIEPTVNEKFA